MNKDLLYIQGFFKSVLFLSLVTTELQSLLDELTLCAISSLHTQTLGPWRQAK